MLDMLTDMPVLLALSGLAALFLLHAWRSEKRIAALESENGNLARSIDAIMRSPRRADGSEGMSQLELGRRFGEELVPGARTEAIDADHAARRAAPSPAPPPPVEAAAEQSSADPERVAAALAGMIADDRLEISLQPIVSVSLGQSVGFEVLTRIDLPQGDELHIRRIPDGSGIDPVELDLSVFLVAVDTARRRLGSVSERMRLHISMSESVLQDDQGISDICALVALHPGIARSLVLSLPPEAAREPNLTRASRRLHDAGLTLALEVDGKLRADGRGLPPLDYLKVETDALLAVADTGTEDVVAHLPSRLGLTGTPPVVAFGVDSEEKAMRLIGRGVDLMAGDWFSPPRRLQRVDGDDPRRQENGLSAP